MTHPKSHAEDGRARPRAASKRFGDATNLYLLLAEQQQSAGKVSLPRRDLIRSSPKLDHEPVMASQVVEHRKASLATLGQQVSSLATLLYDSSTSLLHDAASYVLQVPPKPLPIVASSLIVVTGSGGGLSRSLALHFASLGYQVMLQTPFAGQPGDLLQRWSEIKRASASTGALVPLTFSSRDATSRAHAVKTLAAYARDNALTLTAVINCVDARGMRTGNTHAVYAESIGSNDTSSEVIEQQRGGLKKRKVSLTASSDAYYQETPVPLGIATEDHLKDLMGEVIGVIGCVQDFLPLLRNTKGRVINVWSCAAPIGFGPVPTGPLAMVEEAFKAASRTMALELRPFDVSVSIVLPSTTILDGHGPLADRVEPTVSVTNDVRSVLTPSSSPAIRSVFDTQVKLFQKSAKLSAHFAVDEAALWRVVRRAVEARYPKSHYVCGLDMILNSFVESVVPFSVLSVYEQAIWLRWRSWLTQLR